MSLAADTAGGPFLGVSRSLLGRRWRQRAGDDLLGLALAQRLDLPEVLGRLMAARGVQPDTADRYLNPTLRAHLPDPDLLKDMDRAVARLALSVGRRETVAIFGDYDVDGATSAALLMRCLRALDVPVLLYVPDRKREGYGPNAPALLELQTRGAKLVVTVDCGIAAHAALAEAAAAGLEVIVIDHHAAEPRLPASHAIVNPNRLDDTSGVGTLAAVGVTFLVLVGLLRALRAAGYFTDRPEPDLLQWLDLVAVGTVCDVVPLAGLNRALVAQGVKVLGHRLNPGLAALADRAGVTTRPDAYHLGFVLGPRINAGGRVGRSDLGARLLATDDAIEAAALAAELERYNEERRAIEEQVVAAAVAQVEQAGTVGPVVLVHGDDWHQGVIGIVAGRLKERYNRPTCVIAWEGNTGKGSGRSVPGIDLGAAVIAARQAGLLEAGGGHAMAAGFAVARSRLTALSEFLTDRFAALSIGLDPIPELGIDGVLRPESCTEGLCRTLSALGPFGAGNAEPRFVLPHAMVVRADPVGTNHVRCFLSAAGARERIKAIAFRTLDTPLGEALLRAATGGPPLHVAGHLRADTWQGRSDVQMIIDDAAWPTG